MTATSYGGVRLGVAGAAQGHQLIEVEVRAALGALDDMMDIAPAAPRLGSFLHFTRRDAFESAADTSQLGHSVTNVGQN